MKKRIISVAIIIMLLIAVFSAIKTGKIKIFDNDNVSDNKKAGEEIVEKGNSDNKNREEYTLDKLIILNLGEEGDYVREGKTENIHYHYKYIESGITKEKPEGIVIDFYKDGEEKIDNVGSFLDDTYYVTVKYEVINMCEGDKTTFAPQTFSLGYYDENKFTVKCEPRGHSIEGSNAIKGNVSIEKGESVIITSCYCVKEDILKKGNIVIQASAMQESKVIKMPYFAISTDGVAK